jgi:hypothetical protein
MIGSAACSDSGPTTADDAGAGDGGRDARGDAQLYPWKAISVEGTLCRDGNQTGFGVSFNPDSHKLLIFMEGGGACFNEISCLQNPDSWAPTDMRLASSLNRNWILNRASDNNPFRDWNMVYIPYCSGDVHTGTTTSGYMGQPQQGFLNYKKDLAQIVSLFPTVDQVLLTGVSAGGFGVAWNWAYTQDAFGSTPVYALDDSGPPMGPDFLSACQQKRYGELWGWNGAVHPVCKDCDVSAGNVVRPLVSAVLKTYTSTRLGLLSYDEDGTIKSFFAYGINNCADWDSNPAPVYPTGKYPMGLADIRQAWAPYPHAAVYVVTGVNHTFLGSDIANVKTGPISMIDWIQDLVERSPAWVSVAP